MLWPPRDQLGLVGTEYGSGITIPGGDHVGPKTIRFHRMYCGIFERLFRWLRDSRDRDCEYIERSIRIQE